MLLAIDPGPVESAWVEYEGGQPTAFAKESNELVLRRVHETSSDRLAIEKIVSYGRPVGQDTFATCVWCGRFEQMWHDRIWAVALNRKLQDFKSGPVVHVTRLQVKQYVCKSGKAKDGAVRQALIDRWGGVEGKAKAIGKKAAPGPLYGISKDVWQALGVAVAADEAEFFGGALVVS